MSQLTIEAPDDEACSLLQAQKPIRPYICSAQKEFQEERDFLASHVFPQLNECCHARGTFFKAVDLRWAELAAPQPRSPGHFRQHWCLNSQHLKLCLDYVNHCFPFFIALLGHTYGDFQDDYSPFIFSKATDLAGLSVIERNLYVAGQNGYPWVLDSPDCSLVEYEIMQAAFLRQSEFQYFYFWAGNTRLGPSKPGEEAGEEAVMSAALMMEEEEKIRIGKLKSKIINRGLHVRYYKNLSELGELVLTDWLIVIEKLYPASLRNENIDYKHDLERFYHQEFIEKCKQVFVVSKESSRTFDILEKFALSSMGFDDQSPTADASLESLLRISTFPTYKSILLLSGERGCGKSTLIASWVNDFKSKYPDMLLIPHFVGSTCDSSDIMSVVHYFVTELQYENYGTLLKTDIFDKDASVLIFSHLIEAFMASISSKPCILVLDGVEELIGTYGISGQKAKDFSWLPHALPPSCKLILSSVSSSLSCKALCARPDVRMVEVMNPWHEEARARIFRQHFIAPNDNYPFCRYRQILKRKPSLNALKLAVLSTELNECRIYRDELQCLKEFLDTGSTQELWELVLKRWVQDYSWAAPAKEKAGAGPAGEGLDGWVASTLSLLSLSHCGLTEEEIFQLLDVLGYRGEHRVTMLHWAAFRNAAHQWVREKPSGVLYFHHQSLRTAVEHRLLGALAPVRENSLLGSTSPSDKIMGLYKILIEFFRQHTAYWRVYQELPWYLKESESWEELCTFLSSPSVVDQLSKLPSPSFWMGLHLVHYWDVLLKVGYHATPAYLSTVSKIKAGQCRKEKRRLGLSALECRTFEITVVDKCRLLFFIGKFLKFLGKISEAEDLFLNVENILLEQSPPATEILLNVQNTLGELYLDIGMAQEGFQYFGKVLSNLSPNNFQGKKELVKQNVFGPHPAVLRAHFYSVLRDHSWWYLGNRLCQELEPHMQVRALSNLVKSASKEYLRENHILEIAFKISCLMDRHPCDEATMKHTEGVLIFLAGNTCLAKAKLYECLYIRKRLFGGKSILVGETMEFLADLLSFSPRDCEKVSRKQAIEFYKEVIRIKENSGAHVNSPLIRKQLSISLSDTLCKLASQLLLSDSSSSILTEATGHLYRSLDLRTTHLGSAHPSVPGILHLLREIESMQSKKGWPPVANVKYWESGRKGDTVRELLLQLNYHATRSSTGPGSARDTRTRKSARCTKALDLIAYPMSEKSKGAPGKGKTDWRSRTAEEKTQQKMQQHSGIWEVLEKEATEETYSLEILPLRETGGKAQLALQRVLSPGT